MKKRIKIISLMLSVILSLVFFSGCSFIDKQRKLHGVWTKEETIMLNGTEFVKFTAVDSFKPTIPGDMNNNIYVTDEDVPLLLRFAYGTYFNYDETKDFLILNNEYSYDYSDRVYCRKDKYDKYMKYAENATADILCYEYEYYESGINYSTDVYILTEEEEEAIYSIHKYLEPLDIYEGVAFNVEYSVIIEGSSENMLFRNDYGMLFTAGNRVYFELYEIDPNIDEEVINIGNSNIYLIPKNDDKIFRNILKAEIDTYNSLY
ncbi:MAG: hypothetical protein IKU52_07450 [Clostridia bacterium]|nr:hypothetical protein [Clostridia bacterium]